MAWRLEEMVICGEINNRLRDHVTGQFWLAGHPQPVQLHLRGNCWRDLAGRCLQFTNPRPRLGGLASIDLLQAGVVGDMTASRKVRVPDVPLERLEEYELAGKKFPWHWGNALYLEWFSRRNGRVVIEAAGFEMKIIGESTWEMSAEEERSQHEANGSAIKEFMQRLTAGRRFPEPDDEDGEEPGNLAQPGVQV